MTTDMGPPPPRNPTPDQSPSTETPTKIVDDMKKNPMGPPPPIHPIPLISEPEKSVQPQLPEDSSVTADEEPTVSDSKIEEKKPSSNVGAGVAVPYTIPTWSEPPCHKYFLEVLKEGSIIDQFHVHEKGAYMFGRVDLCDFVLEHPTISRFHAVLQFNKSGGAFLYDLSSTHGTFINKNQVKKKVYVELHVGDVLRFGHSSRLYIFQGPADLMPAEKDLKSIKIRDERRDMEASLLRAKREAALSDGISWGMDEDAIEENEDELEEITWQTFKGQLTEKQEKTREKVLKRLEKIGNMKKEIDAIRAKDISQGGLTQGQQVQIARNEQRMAQVAEELENLEETLNESIRESMGARVGGVRGKKKGAAGDEEDEYMSDEDEFYDRTRKKASKQKGAENQSVETADSLLDKKDLINKEIEEKKKLLSEEKSRSKDVDEEAGDVLDAFMSGLSSQLVQDKRKSVQKELDVLQSELERVLYLLKIADPAGEAARKRESVTTEVKQIVSSVEKNSREKAEEMTPKQTSTKSCEAVTETKAPINKYTVNKHQWLGAVEETKEPKKASIVVDSVVDSEQFVDYKDRKEVLGDSHVVENAAPGLIIRKRKKAVEEKNVEIVGVDTAAEDAVALLLKHTKGIRGLDEDDGEEKKKVKKASFNSEPDYESWVPPEGQSGDGRTSLNDRLGY